MFNIFTAVKEAVTTRQAAEYYGFPVNRSGMICCPFHKDKHPSMKVDERYYCFGCHETGDVINFVAKLYGLSNYEAAKKLSQDFGIDPHTPVPTAASKAPKGKPVWQQRKDEGYCASVLINYERLLKQWQNQYAPATPDDPWDKRFASACKTLPGISDLLDCLYSPDAELRKNTAEALVKTGAIARLEGILEYHKGEDRDVRIDADFAA